MNARVSSHPATPLRGQGISERDRQLLLGSAAYAMHGLFFLLLVVGALIRFGPVFDVLGGVVAVLALSSLKQAWTGFRAYLGR